MDVLTAHTSSGFLHAVTCDYPKGFGVGFERTMTAQRMTVTRYSMDNYLKRQRESRSQTAQKTASTQAIRTLESESALPELGQDIVHHVIGYATVTHTVTLDDHAVRVATGPRGSTLIHGGQWREATEADKPFWMRSTAGVSPKSLTGGHEAPTCRPEQHEPLPEPEVALSPAVPVSTLVDIPQAAPAPLSPAPAPSSGPAFKAGDWIRQYPNGTAHLVSSKGTFTRCGQGIRSTAAICYPEAKTVRCGLCEKAARLESEASARRGHT